MLITLKRKTWYYETNDPKKRRKDGYPSGGFLDMDEKLLVCEVKKIKTGALKMKSLHCTKNTIYMFFDEKDASYFFKATNTCN